ncbi:hypothetical protein LEA_01486 [human gut metagenome]|uniref:Uncharacterized protein n=1 Tax=human gut metagenome TaxID=408170 RepID=K1UDZ2_9ZZZZ
MPKWTEYTSKDTLADNDEVMLYDATARANKRGLMSKFWDYVVDKMATAVISKLKTNNKTIIGAINALNGNIERIEPSNKKTFRIRNERAWIFIFNLGENGNDGMFDIFLYTPSYSDVPTIRKVTNKNSIILSASIDGKNTNIESDSVYNSVIVLYAA